MPSPTAVSNILRRVSFNLSPQAPPSLKKRPSISANQATANQPTPMTGSIDGVARRKSSRLWKDRTGRRLPINTRPVREGFAP